MIIYLLDYQVSPATVDNGVNSLDGTEIINDTGSDDDSCGISCPPDFSDDSNVDSASDDEPDDDDEISSLPVPVYLTAVTCSHRMMMWTNVHAWS